MSIPAIDIVCPIGHTMSVKIKERLVEYFYTPSGKAHSGNYLQTN